MIIKYLNSKNDLLGEYLFVSFLQNTLDDFLTGIGTIPLDSLQNGFFFSLFGLL